MKRFWNAVTLKAQDDHLQVMLDDRPARFGGQHDLATPQKELAEAIKAEWEDLTETFQWDDLPLSALFARAGQVHEADKDRLLSDCLTYATTDMLLFRAPHPQGLTAWQDKLWDPVLHWMAREHDICLTSHTSLTVRPQEEALERKFHLLLKARLTDAAQITAFHSLTHLLGSVYLAFALLDDFYSPEKVWQAAHVEEAWNRQQWGEDYEAAQISERKKKQFLAATRLLRF
jgi:chaperone required for assembly of F1-ATPase